MNAGELTERITILRQGAPVDDGYTTQPGALATYCERAAKWRAATPREVFENMGREAKAGGTFWLRHDPVTEGILATDKLVWQGRTFDIVGVEETEPRVEMQISVAADDEG